MKVRRAELAGVPDDRHDREPSGWIAVEDVAGMTSGLRSPLLRAERTRVGDGPRLRRDHPLMHEGARPDAGRPDRRRQDGNGIETMIRGGQRRASRGKSKAGTGAWLDLGVSADRAQERKSA
jgi:hypothetical protein